MVSYPSRPQIFEADPFAAAQQGFAFSKGIADERRGKDAFGRYIDTLTNAPSNQPMQTAMPQSAAIKSPSALSAIGDALQPTFTSERDRDAMFMRGETPPDGGIYGANSDLYFNSIRSAESGGNDAARNPNSSATGRYQFLDSTWNGLMQSNPELGLTADGRTDPAQQERAIREFTAQNARTLSSAGLPVNPGTLYAAHFLGGAGASNVLSQPDPTPIAQIVGADVVQANPQLANMTVGDFKGWAAQKGTGGNGGYVGPQASEPFPTATGPRQVNVPADVLQALYSSPDTRQLALSLAQAKQQGLEFQPLQTFQRADGSTWQINAENGALSQVADAPKPLIVNDQIVDPRSGKVIADLRGKGGVAGSEEYYGTTVSAQAPDGTVKVYQLSKNGIPKEVDLGGGQYLPTTRSVDTGTEVVQVGPGGVRMGETIFKNNELESYQKANGTAAGKAAAERLDALPGLISNADNMISTIDGVLNDPALDYSTGWLAWMQNAPGTDSYRFGQRALQLQGQSFLQAFDSLSGGGAITEIEGQKATQAIGRLSTAQSPQDYRDALNELKGIISASKERAQARAGTSTAPAPAAATQGDVLPPINSTAVARPQTEAEYAAIPSGGMFIDPDDGKTYRKP